MRRAIKQGVSIVLLLLFLVIPLTSCSQEAEDPRIFIALGDSVSAGFGMAETERYTVLFFEKLKEVGYIDKYVNMAEIGFTTTMLLELLNNMDDYNLSLFDNAGVVTLNIGGNDILSPLIDYLPTPEEAMHMVFELWDFIQESIQIISETMDIASEFQEALDNFSLWRVWELPSLNRMVQDASPVLEDVTNLYDRVYELGFVRLLPMLFGDFSPDLDAKLREGVEIFSVEFAEIIAWLNIYAPNAVIIVNTVYNPIPTQMLGISTEEISGRANALVKSINNIIQEKSEISGYLVADIYAGFTNAPDNLVNFFIDTSAMMLSFDIIHPSSAGHSLIAGISYESFSLR